MKFGYLLRAAEKNMEEELLKFTLETQEDK